MNLLCGTQVLRAAKGTVLASRLVSIQVGHSARVEKCFTAADVERFAELTGDSNRIHFDSDYARQFGFSRRIVHGALINGVISALIGTKLPGPGSILLEQNLRFPNPLFVEERFVTEVRIARHRLDIYHCEYECRTLAGKTVTQGMAKILFRPSNNN